MKNIRVKDLKLTLLFYKCKVPHSLFQLKRRANSVLISKLCVSNCDCEQKYKKLLYVLHKKRMISPQKKVKYDKTKKKRFCLHKQTRICSPVSYLDA